MAGKGDGMKKAVYLYMNVCVFCFMVVPAICAYSQTVSLDEAIIFAGMTVENSLKPGTKVAVVNFNSDTAAFSRYVIEELMDYLTNSNKLVVVERARLNVIWEEMDLQLSGDVSDESAQAIGRQLGAQSIISGSFTDTGSVFRFRAYSINVESTAREASTSLSVNRNDIQVRFLLVFQTGNTVATIPGQTGNTVATIPEQPGNTVPISPDQPVIPPRAANAVYAIGDTGPAGGIVFYDKGSFSGGWRYLEAAPVEIEFSAPLGAVRDNVNTQTATGQGRRNTQLIVEQSNRSRENGMAAQRCAGIDFDGFKDWFIPSKDEMDLLYKNLRSSNIGGFGSGRYASSSQSGRASVWIPDFGNGRQTDAAKSVAYTFRVIRSF
jgi:TolB-like protein